MDSSPGTLLAQLVAADNRTHGEIIAGFNRLATGTGENANLSPRTFRRWMAGSVGTRPRPAACRVARAYWGRSMAELLGPPAPSPRAGVGSISADQPGSGLGASLLLSTSAGGAARLSEALGLAHAAPGAPTDRLVAGVARESTWHATEAASASVRSDALELVHTDVVRLARDYWATPPLWLLYEARQLRDLTLQLAARTRRPTQLADLYLAAGQLCALMSVASFDLALLDSAREQAAAARTFGELAGHPGVQAWATGVSSLVAYWTGRPQEAAQYAAAGLTLAPPGTARMRLHSIAARAWSHLGDADRTRAQSNAAASERDRIGGDDLHDGIGGEFGWPDPRRAISDATALLQVGDVHAAARLARTTVRAHQTDGFAHSVDTTGRVVLAAAELACGRLDAAVEAVEPVWGLPVDHRRHGLVGRLQALRGQLTGPSYRGAREAGSLTDRIEAFTADTPALAVSAGRLPG